MSIGVPSDLFPMPTCSPWFAQSRITAPGKPNRLVIALTRWGLGVALVLGGGLTHGRAWAADTVEINLNGLKLALTTQELANFAESGELPPKLATLANLIPEKELTTLQAGLQQKLVFPSTGMAQLLNTPPGQRVIEVFGQFIQDSNGQAGGDGLKTALIQATAQPEGLTIIGAIKQFPGPKMSIQANQAIPLINAVFDEISQTKAVIDLVNQQSTAIQTQPPPSTPTDLTAPGRFNWQVKSLTLTNSQAKFQFPVSLYVPNLSGPIPLLVISPGLGEDLNTYAYLAEHLASYGFGVAIIDHPGSDATRQAEFLSGKIPQEIVPQEFINRPQSVSDTLDYLAAIPGSQFLTNNVGIIGHSFGGYDTWALAGAAFQASNLANICKNPEIIIKPSVLLQCDLMGATTPLPNLRDQRIQAGIAINPIGGAIFADSGFQAIEIPLLVLAGSQDFVAPPLLEQFQPFAWLSSAQKYLVLLNGGTHLSTMGDLPPENSPNALPPFVVGQVPGIARNQLQAISVAFMETYIKKQASYQAYLTPAYLAQLSQPQMNASITTELTPAQVQAATSKTP